MSCETPLWLPLVLEHVGSVCPDILVEQHIIRAAREFCERTLAWQQPLSPIDTAAESAIYRLPLPTVCVRKCAMTQSCEGGCGSGCGGCSDCGDGCNDCPAGCNCERVVACELVRVLRVDVGGKQHEVRSGPGSRSVARRNGPVWAGAADVFGLNITITPAPAVDGLEIIADVALKPKLDSGVACLPEVLHGYAQDICKGAAASLMGASSHAWANPVLAASLRQEFLSCCSVAGSRIGWVSSKSNDRPTKKFF